MMVSPAAVQLTVIDFTILSLHPLASVIINFTLYTPGLVYKWDAFCVDAVPLSPKFHCQLLIGLVFVYPRPLKLNSLQETADSLILTESIFGTKRAVSTGMLRLKTLIPSEPLVAPQSLFPWLIQVPLMPPLSCGKTSDGTAAGLNQIVPPPPPPPGPSNPLMASVITPPLPPMAFTVTLLI